jgi:RNA polymerase sigma factor (sigma-70 family)
MSFRWLPPGSGTKKVGPEVYTQSAVDVRKASWDLWQAVLTAGCPTPEEWAHLPVVEWIPLDRNRARVRAYAAGFPTPEVKAAVRAYDRASDACIKTNMGLVYKVAAKLLRKGKLRGMEQDDLVQEGVLGLQRALETFDPERKVSFSTYSYFWIYQTIDRAINNSGTIRVPIKTQDLSAKGKKEGALGDRAREASRVVSLDAKIAENGFTHAAGDLTLMDMIACKQPSPEASFQEHEDHESLRKVLATLTDKECHVLHGRYVEEKTLEEVGATMNLTRERIRQIEAAALAKIRSHVAFGKVGFNG